MQRFSDSAIQRFSDSAIQRFSDSAIQRFSDVPMSRCLLLPAFFRRAVCRRIARVASGFLIILCCNTLTSTKHQSESMKHLHAIVDIHPHTLVL